MHLSERLSHELALKSIIDQKRLDGEFVDVDDFFKKGKKVITITVGSKKFTAEGENALKELTVLLGKKEEDFNEKKHFSKNGKEPLVKKRPGKRLGNKIRKVVKNMFMR